MVQTITKPLLSIIIPTFNAAKTLNTTLENICNQTFKDFEIWIIDNLSQDGTDAIVNRFANQYSNIHWYSESDRGLYDAMNKGIDISQGSWLYFMGSDDLFHTNAILETVFGNPDLSKLDVIYGNVEWGNTNKIYDGKFSVLKILQKNICHQAIFFKRKVFEKHGKFELKYITLADYVFNIKWFNDPSLNHQYIEQIIVRYGTGGFSAQHKDLVFVSERDAIIEEYFPEEYSNINKQLQYFNREIEGQHQEILNRDHSIATRDLEIQIKDEEILNRDHIIASRDLEILNKEREILLKDEEISSGNKEIEILKDEIKRNWDLINNLILENSGLSSKNENELNQLHKLIRERDEHILRLSRSISDLEKLAIQEGIEKERLIAQYNEQLNQISLQLREKDRLMSALHHSLSWRITQPVRGIMDFLLGRQKSKNKDIVDSITNKAIDDQYLVSSMQTEASLPESEEICKEHTDNTAPKSVETVQIKEFTDKEEELFEILQHQHSEYKELEKYVRHLENVNRNLQGQLDQILGSKTWRFSNLIRSLFISPRQTFTSIVTYRLKNFNRFIRAFARSKRINNPIDVAPRTIFVSGESHTPGHVYRIKRYLETYQELGISSKWFKPEELVMNLNILDNSSLIIIWRSGYGNEIKKIMDYARKKRITIIYDLDDYMFDPALAEPEIIDAIRLQKMNKNELKAFFYLIRAAMKNADFFTSPTYSLSLEMSKIGKKAFVLPNGYDFSMYQTSVCFQRDESGNQVRIGYAGGTRTHQKDFEVALPGLVRILEEFPYTLITLFGQTMELTEFPELQKYYGRIENREMVDVESLQLEIARFDINIAPLEINAFCNAKSELKYFEAALLKIPTIASPSTPFTQIISNGINGYLANDDHEWYEYLKLLVVNQEQRKKVGRSAFYQVLWRFSPEERSQNVFNFLKELDKVENLSITYKELRQQAVCFKGKISGFIKPSLLQMPSVLEYNIIREFKNSRFSKVGIIIPLYNYEGYIVNALDSVKNQTYKDLDLVVIDDCSTDRSQIVALDWLEKNHERFNNCALIQNIVNSKLSATRNSGFDYLKTPWILPLDADNELLPKCIARALGIIETSGAALVFFHLLLFGEDNAYIKKVYGSSVIGGHPWNPQKLAKGNYIDAMALISKACWAKAGGYDNSLLLGWEDYDLWLRFAEQGFFGINVPETLARYRVHKKSMLRTITDINQDERRREIIERHPWVEQMNSLPDSE